MPFQNGTRHSLGPISNCAKKFANKLLIFVAFIALHVSQNEICNKNLHYKIHNCLKNADTHILINSKVVRRRVSFKVHCRGFSIVELTIAVAISLIGGLVGSFVVLEGVKKQVQAKTLNESYSFSRNIVEDIIKPQRDFNCTDNTGGRIQFAAPVNFVALESPAGVPVNIRLGNMANLVANYQIPNTKVRIDQLTFGNGVRLGYDTLTGTLLYNAELNLNISEQRGADISRRNIPVGRKTLIFNPTNPAMTAGTFVGCALPDAQAAAQNCADYGKVMAGGICVNPNSGTLGDDPNGGCGPGRILMGTNFDPGTGVETKNCVTYNLVCGQDRFIVAFDDSGFVTCSAPITREVLTATPTPAATTPTPTPTTPQCYTNTSDPCADPTTRTNPIYSCPYTYDYCPPPTIAAVTATPAPTPLAAIPSPIPPNPAQPTGGSCTCGGQTIPSGYKCGTCYADFLDYWGGTQIRRIRQVYLCQAGEFISQSATTYPLSLPCQGDYYSWP
jgi:hypothetical protein